jgi:putative flippase GtrA
VGFTTFGIYVSTFHLSYDSFQLDYKLAASIAYIITITSHFLLHRLFTFSAMGQEVGHNMWRYVLMLAINYVIMMIVMWLTITVINTSPYLGLVASTSITMVLNFLMMKYFVFSLKQTPNEI